MFAASDVSGLLAAGQSVSVEGAGTYTVSSVSSSTVVLATATQFAGTSNVVGAAWALAGALSTVVTAETTVPTLPAAAPVASVLATTGGAALVSLSPPLDTGGVPVLGYRLLQFEGFDDQGDTSAEAAGELELVTSVGTFLGVNVEAWVTALNPEQTYALVVVAENVMSECTAQDQAPLSEIAVAVTTAATPPTEPLTLTIVAATGGSLSLSWSPPLDAGGLPLEEYEVWLDSAPPAVEEGVSEGSGSGVGGMLVAPESGERTWQLAWEGLNAEHTIYGLTASPSLAELNEIEVKVTSSNAVGVSPAGLALRHQMPTASPPASPTDTALCGSDDCPQYLNWVGTDGSGATGGALAVQWTAPLDEGGAPLTEYRVSASRVSDGAVAASGVVSHSENTHVLYGLTANTEYDVRVSAVNDASGEGLPSEATRLTTLDVSAPSPPLAPTLVQATGGVLRVAWSPPADSGGSPVSHYVLTLDGATALEVSPRPRPLSYPLSHLTDSHRLC